jgi:hypothetical protein
MNRRGENSRKGENLKLRTLYRQANYNCELSVLFPEGMVPAERGFTALVGHDDPIHVHHIMPGRKDLWSNLLSVRMQIHTAWGHDRYPNDLRIVCLAMKARKGELDVPELESCLKQRTVLKEWVEAQLPKLRLPIGKRMHRELLDYLEAKL